MSVGCCWRPLKRAGFFIKSILQSGANTVIPLERAKRLSGLFLDISGTRSRKPGESQIVYRRAAAGGPEGTGVADRHRGSLLKPVLDGRYCGPAM
jgi:hypothetical protein